MRILRNKNQKGFTLIELLVVIAIIGLLASVVLLALNSARAKSRDAKRLADVRQIASAMELYFNDRSSYPTSAGSITGAVFSSANAPGLSPSYIGVVPSAPTPADSNATNNCLSTAARGSNNYWYEAPTTGNTYTLTFCLGDTTGGYASGPRTLTPAGIQ